MLDNFGFGEFFTLALLALLFFGPEQLPRIGARIGRWVRNMTGYSRAFLDEWREEALVIHDAVEEVKGIRAEINAARAEIASTMNTARTDLGEAVDGAKLDVRGQIRDGTQIQIAPANETSGIGRSGTQASVAPVDATAGDAVSGTAAAIDKTQRVLDGVAAGGSAVSPARVGGETAEGTKDAAVAGSAKGEAPPRAQTAPRTELGIAAPRQERARLAMTGAGSVSRADLARLRGDVSDLSAHVSALRGELARIRALVAGEAEGAAPETGGAS